MKSWIELYSNGLGQVRIDGHRLEHLVTGLQVRARVNELPHVELDLTLVDGVVIEVDGEVTVSPEVSTVLTSMGWSPPGAAGP